MNKNKETPFWLKIIIGIVILISYPFIVLISLFDLFRKDNSGKTEEPKPTGLLKNFQNNETGNKKNSVQ